MIPRVVLGAFLAVVMVVVGVGTYIFIGTRQSHVAAPPQLPTAAKPVPGFTLPGTLVLSQDGGLFALSYGRFHEITPLSGWMQPSFMPNGNLLVVHRTGFYSDVWIVSRLGRPLKQLTNDIAPPRSYDTGDNHWAFYPRATNDGGSIFFSYDSPKYGYEVDLSVWQMPANGGIRSGRLWSDTYADPGYTGGDLQPVPVPGGIVYTRYDRNPDGSIFSQLWLTTSPGSFGRPLTTSAEDCREPSFSAGYTYVAMICTYGQQVSNLVIAPYVNGHLGARKTLIDRQMVAQPTWAPDGSGIAYLAPAEAAAPFQLWFLPRAAYFQPVPSPSPSATGKATASPSGSASASPSPAASPSPVSVPPIQITANNGFDATSTIAWVI